MKIGFWLEKFLKTKKVAYTNYHILYRDVYWLLRLLYIDNFLGGIHTTPAYYYVIWCVWAFRFNKLYLIFVHIIHIHTTSELKVCVPPITRNAKFPNYLWGFRIEILHRDDDDIYIWMWLSIYFIFLFWSLMKWIKFDLIKWDAQYKKKISNLLT